DGFAAANGLAAGQIYPLDLFYAHRGASGNHAPQIQLDLDAVALCDAIAVASPVAVTLPNRVGRAADVGGVTRLVATADVGPTGGAAWSQTMLPVVNGFSLEFDYKVTGTNAEGFAFVLQAQSPTARGGDGANLDYAGIDHSIAVEFDPHTDP